MFPSVVTDDDGPTGVFDEPISAAGSTNSASGSGAPACGAEAVTRNERTSAKVTRPRGVRAIIIKSILCAERWGAGLNRFMEIVIAVSDRVAARADARDPQRIGGDRGRLRLSQCDLSQTCREPRQRSCIASMHCVGANQTNRVPGVCIERRDLFCASLGLACDQP